MTDGKLPADVDRRLAAIAAGRGRTASAAHPECTCLATAKAHADRMGEPGAQWASADVKACPIHGGAS